MGSLMGGWDSPVLGDDNKVRVMRNRSLTNEEVETFWRQNRKKPAAEDGGEIITSPLVASPGAMEKSPFGSLERRMRTSPLASRRGAMIDADDDDAGESPSKSRDWWTRSNWAFLNEPPQEYAPGTAQSYTPQFDVARIASGDA